MKYFLNFQSSVCISILLLITLRESIALKPAVILRKMNDEMVPESVYIGFLECGSENDTIWKNQEFYDEKNRKQDELDMKTSTIGAIEIMKSEIMKMKQEFSNVIIEQIRLKDLLIQNLLEKNNNLQLLLNGAGEDCSIRSTTSAEIKESMISCFLKKLKICN